MRAMRIGLALVAVSAVAGCATAPKRLAVCKGDPGTQGTPFNLIDRQGFALGGAMEGRFGKQRHGYHWLVRQPRPTAIEPSGNLVFDLYDIYPDAGEGPTTSEPPRSLRVILHPCTLAVVRTTEPSPAA